EDRRVWSRVGWPQEPPTDGLDRDLARGGRAVVGVVEDDVDVPASLRSEPLVGVWIGTLSAGAGSRRSDHPAAQREGPGWAKSVEALGVVVALQREGRGHQPHLPGRSALPGAGSRPVPSVDPDVPGGGVEDVETFRAEPGHADPVAVRALLQDVDDP